MKDTFFYEWPKFNLLIIKYLKNKFKKSFLKIRFILLFILIFAEVKTNKITLP